MNWLLCGCHIYLFIRAAVCLRMMPRRIILALRLLSYVHLVHDLLFYSFQSVKCGLRHLCMEDSIRNYQRKKREQ